MAISEANRKELLAEAQRRVAAADGGQTSTLATQRLQADKYYRGEPFGDEVSGRSQVVSRDVAQYVDSQMPSLMRVFASGDEVVVFEPTQPQDEEGAKQATDYVTWVWRQNDGFVRFHNWFKDGLLFKLGVVKIWWDETEERTREVYRALTDEQLAAIQADEDVEVGEVTSDSLSSLVRLPNRNSSGGTLATFSRPFLLVFVTSTSWAIAENGEPPKGPGCVASVDVTSPTSTSSSAWIAANCSSVSAR